VKGAAATDAPDYPIQLSKVQAPPLREDILARDRLLDWLSIKVHSRVVLLVAEAGYGKTTLLADFSRRTRIRVLWFRLDRGDRDWVGFLAHLVAAVRVHVPAFGTATASLLRQSATTSLSLDAALDTFLRELNALPNDPAALVFDDVHLVDESADVRQILREVLNRAPDRMSFVFASRREPPVRLARLRALGEVAELGTDDLRFDAVETEKLFRETYEMALEPSVLAELGRRTEGWAASLQLVRSALHDRNPTQVRMFISSLSGAEGHLYEYLAEEVIGDLPDDLQQFLMRTSLLDTVDLTLGPVAAGTSEEVTRAFIEQSERHGLFSRRATQVRHVVRAHPLVRDFLRLRLRGWLGRARERELHKLIAAAAEGSDWETAARHYVAAGKNGDALRVLSAALEKILATGAYAVADEIANDLGVGDEDSDVTLVLRSRLAQQQGATREAIALAEQAWDEHKHSIAVLVNLTAARATVGDVSGMMEAARLLERSGRPEFARLGRATLGVMETSVEGSLDRATRDVQEMIGNSIKGGASHYLGVALLNHSLLQIAQCDFAGALESSSDAIRHLESSSAVVELVSAHVAHASSVALFADIGSARDEFNAAIDAAPAGQALEVAGDVAEIEALVGETRFAWPLIQGVADQVTTSTGATEIALYARALLYLRDGDLELSRADIAEFHRKRPVPAVAFEARRLLAQGLLLGLAGEETNEPAVEGARLAARQGAWFWARYGDLLVLLADRRADPSEGLVRLLGQAPVVISCLAELVLLRISELSGEAFRAVVSEAEKRPGRWREPTRRALAAAEPRSLQRLSELLARVGELDDVTRLRQAARRGPEHRGPGLAVSLARRLAVRVFVEDLGRVQVAIGSRLVDSSDLRRKVLALLCLLLSKPRFSSTREEVLDNLWPDHDPASALNSLNQTVYFLRRVFEPDFRDDTSPGYVGQDGETIWLDADLVDSRSRRCLAIIRSMPGEPTSDGAVALASEYTGRFALDFAYEEWAAPFREALHASYLRVVERAVRLDLDSGHFERGTFIAERAAEIDPDSEEIQVALVRLYRHAGAHAAAAEQYARYSRTMRDLGTEPVEFADL
jgi:DNA-binding SARP family transcriptional activator